MKQSEVKALVIAQNEGAVDSCYGPFQLGFLEVWEIWVKQDGAFDTRFVLSEHDKEPAYFSNFGLFCAFVNGRESRSQDLIDELKHQTEAARSQHLYKLVSLTAATCVFVGSFVALVYFMAAGVPANLSYLGLLGGLIASGATMFFGNWKMPK